MSIIRSIVVASTSEFISLLQHLGWFEVPGQSFLIFRNVTAKDNADKKDTRVVTAQHMNDLSIFRVTVKDEEFKIIEDWAKEKKTPLIETTASAIIQNKDMDV
jgi:hypothetical protein